MVVSSQDFKKELEAMDISGGVLVFPNALRKRIDDDHVKAFEAEFEGLDVSGSAVSFIKFTPRSYSVRVPVLAPKKKKDKEGKQIVEKKIINTGIDAIILPIRSTTDSIDNDFSSVEGLGFRDLGKYLLWRLKKGGMGMISAPLPKEVAISMKRGIFGGGMDNPHDDMLYGGYQRRTFDLSWEFLKPVNQEEEELLMKLVSIFRMSSIGGYGELVITPPVTWDISFHSLPNYPSYLRFKKCAFDCEVVFGGDSDGFKAMESGAPFISLSLKVQELVRASRKDLWIKPTDNFVDKIVPLDKKEQKNQDKLDKKSDKALKGKK